MIKKLKQLFFKVQEEHIFKSKVRSTNLEFVKYNDLSKVLTIKFRNSSNVYNYYNVRPKVVLELMKASSVGSYFARNIRSHYRCKKIS